MANMSKINLKTSELWCEEEISNAIKHSTDVHKHKHNYQIHFISLVRNRITISFRIYFEVNPFKSKWHYSFEDLICFNLFVWHPDQQASIGEGWFLDFPHCPPSIERRLATSHFGVAFATFRHGWLACVQRPVH